MPQQSVILRGVVLMDYFEDSETIEPAADFDTDASGDDWLCDHCGETNELSIDVGLGQRQQFTQDCSVC